MRECLGSPKSACALLKSLFIFQLLEIAELICLLTPSAQLYLLIDLVMAKCKLCPVILLCSTDNIASIISNETYLLR